MFENNFVDDTKIPGFMNMTFDMKHLKRGRSNSISNRLRTASDLEECGIVDKYEKGMLKDHIISGDTELENAIEIYKKSGDTTALKKFLEQSREQPSIELLDGLELDFLNFYSAPNGRKGSRFDSFDSDFSMSAIDALDTSNVRKMASSSSLIPNMLSDENLIVDPPEFTNDNKNDIFTSMSERDRDIEAKYRRANRTNSLESNGSFSAMVSTFDVDLFNVDGVAGGGRNRKDSFCFNDINVNSAGSFDYSNTLATNNFAFQKNIPQDIDLSNYDVMAATLQNATGEDGTVTATSSTSTIPEYRPMNSSLPSYLQPGSFPKYGSVLNPGGGIIDANGNRLPGVAPIMIPKPTPQGPGGKGFIGAYSPESRRMLIERFNEKKKHRVWTKKVKYDVRKNFADSRLRVKGRFVKKEDEEIMRVLREDL